MTTREPEPVTFSKMAHAVDYLVLEWGLTEWEAASVIELGACLASDGQDWATVFLHMEVRAEIMALVGCELEDFAEDLSRGERPGRTLT